MPSVENAPINTENEKIDLSGFDSLLTKGNPAPTEPVKPTEAAKPVEPAEPAKETPVKPVEPSKPTNEDPVSKVKPIEVPTNERVFEGVDPQEVPLWKQMSNDAYNKLYPKYKELLAKSTKVDEYEKKLQEASQAPPPVHPQSYLLDPNYQQAALTQQKVNAEVNYWRQQYSKIRKGEDWEDLNVDAQGNLVKIVRPADADAEAELQQRMSMGQQLLMQQQQAMQYIEANYAKIYQDSLGRIKAVEHQYFPGMKDEASLAKNEHYTAIKGALNSLGQSHNPLGGVISKLYTAFMDLAGKYNAKLEEEKAKAAQAQVQAKVGPSSESLGAAQAKKTEDESLGDALSAFDKIIKAHS